MKLAFILDFPGIGSWNGKSTINDRQYAVWTDVPTKKRAQLIENSPYFYRWDDGWEARIRCVPMGQARKEVKHSAGFRRYEWMVASLIESGDIHYDEKNSNAYYPTL